MLFTEFNFYKLNFIEPASPLMYGIIELHDHIFFFLNMILFIVLFLIATTVKLFTYNENTKLNKYLLSESVKNKFDWLRLNHGTNIEIIWTVIPSIILVLIAIPSFALLYATDELVDPAVTIQVIGHQWYWSYEYNDLVVTTQYPLYFSEAQKISINIKATLLINYISNLYDLEHNQALNIISLNQLYKLVNLSVSDWNFFVKVLDVKKDVVLNLLFETYDNLPGKLNFNFNQKNTLINFQIANVLSSWGFTNDFITSKNYTSKLFFEALIDQIGNFKKNNNSIMIQDYLHGSFEFDSYLKSEDDLQPGEQRLYETDFPLVLPKNTHIRFMITADDVIHSWSVPALGIKVDAVPGRINHAHTFIKRSGIFYGQCSELCGVNHAFMPIQIIAFEPNMYYNYLRLVLLSK